MGFGRSLETSNLSIVNRITRAMGEHLYDCFRWILTER